MCILFVFYKNNYNDHIYNQINNNIKNKNMIKYFHNKAKLKIMIRHG